MGSNLGLPIGGQLHEAFHVFWNNYPTRWNLTWESKYKVLSSTVNLEFDMLAKYVSKQNDNKTKSKITESFLKNNGFY